MSGVPPVVPLEVAGGARSHRWSLLVGVVLGAVLLYFAVRGVDWGNVWRVIAGARWPFLGAAASMASLAYFLRSLRWRILLNAEGRFSVGAVFWAMMAGYLGNNLLPARAGELVRTYLISRQSKLSKTYVLTTALSERLMDVVALVLTSSVVLLRIDPKPQWMEDAARPLAAAAALGVLAVVALPYTGDLLAKVVERLPLPARIKGLALGLLKQILTGLASFHNWQRLAGFIGLTAMIWASDAAGVMLAVYALNLRISFEVALLLLTGLGLGSALPSTPGFVGIYQAVAVTVLPPFGISRDSALAYILVAQAMGYVIVLAFGLPGFYRFSRGKRALQETAS
jgi:glycosyltransferase 2 family protein